MKEKGCNNELFSILRQTSVLARIITVMVLLTGAMSLMQLNLQEYPDAAMDTAEIETIYPGATAQDIELNITNPIEKELRSVDGIAYFSSESSEGRSFIEVEYLPGEDAAVILRDYSTSGRSSR